MPPPRTPYDDELRSFVESRPPSPRLASAQERVAARLDTPTGIHDLEDLKRQLQEQTMAAMHDKLDEEHEARLRAERALEKVVDERRKFWGTVIAGVLTLVIIGVLGFVAVRILALPAPK